MWCVSSLPNDSPSSFPDTGRVHVLEGGQVDPNDALGRPYHTLKSSLVQLGGGAEPDGNG